MTIERNITPEKMARLQNIAKELLSLKKALEKPLLNKKDERDAQKQAGEIIEQTEEYNKGYILTNMHIYTNNTPLQKRVKTLVLSNIDPEGWDNYNYF